VAIPGDVLVYTDKDRLEGQCVDLGMGGMKVHSAWPTYTRRLVALEAFVAGERLRLDAELLRHEEVSEGHALVFRFVDTPKQTQRALERIILDRLAESSQRDYERAFEVGALGGGGPRGPESRSGRSEGAPVPVISGSTQAIAVEAPAVERGHTMIASASPAAGAAQVGASETAVFFDESWDEEEADTSRFRRITDDVGPGHTVRMDREGRPLPPEPTMMVSVAEVIAARGGPGASSTRPLAELGPPNDEVEPRTERMVRGAPGGRPVPQDKLDRTMIVSAAELSPPAPEVPEVPVSSTTASERPAQARSGPTSPPEPVAPPLLRGGVLSAPRSLHGDLEVDTVAAVRPSQRALLDAKALLRPRSGGAAPPRRPRVIVTIPHHTYRRRSRIRGLR